MSKQCEHGSVTINLSACIEGDLDALIGFCFNCGRYVRFNKHKYEIIPDNMKLMFGKKHLGFRNIKDVDAKLYRIEVGE